MTELVLTGVYVAMGFLYLTAAAVIYMAKH